MNGGVVGVLGCLALFAGLCIGGILAGNRRSRELSWVAMAATAGVVAVTFLAILT